MAGWTVYLSFLLVVAGAFIIGVATSPMLGAGIATLATGLWLVVFASGAVLEKRLLGK